MTYRDQSTLTSVFTGTNIFIGTEIGPDNFYYLEHLIFHFKSYLNCYFAVPIKPTYFLENPPLVSVLLPTYRDQILKIQIFR